MKNKLSKIMSLLLCLVFVTSLVVGCGSNQQQDPQATTQSDTKETAKPAEVKTVKVWTHSRAYKDIMVPLVEQWNTTTGKEKGIVIDYSVYGDDYKDVINLAMSSGQAPELHTYPYDVVAAVNAGNLLPLEDVPGGQDIINSYDKTSLKPIYNIINNKTYAVPIGTNTIKMVYNKDLFKKAGIVDDKGDAKPPVTWAEVVDYAKRITAVGEGKAFGTAFPMKWVNGFFEMEILYPFYCSIGHEWFDVKNGKYNFSAFKPAFTEYMLKIKSDGSYFPNPETLDNDPARAQFSEGKIGMKMAVSWDVAVFNDQFPAKIDWGVCDLPVLDPSAVRYKEPIRPSTNYFINKTAKENDINKVMEVYNFVNGDQVNSKLYEEAKLIPFRAEAVQLAQKQPNKVGWKEFSTFTSETSFARTSDPTGSIKLEGLDFNQVMLNIWLGKVSVDQGLADLDKRYNDALDKAIAEGKVDISVYKNPDYDIKR